MYKRQIEYIHGLPVVKSFGQDGVSVQRFRDACRDNKAIRIKNEFGFVPWNCLHLFSLKAAAVGLVFTAGWQTMNGTLELPVLLMAAMFSFTIFGSVESINDAAHILSVTDSVLDRLEELEGTELPDQDGKDVSLERYDICFDHVSFGYGTREVIHDVSFQLPQNSATAIVGPSGSGKSTLLRTIAGLHPMAGGQITVDGVPVKNLTRRQMAQKITYMPQSRTIPNITARKMVLHGRFPYLSYPRRYRKEDYEAARRAMERSDAWELADSPVQSLSGGQRQKVYLAMAMAQETQTILMDEPTTYLDIQHQLSLMTVAQQMAGQGTAVVLVLHDLCLALRFSDRCVLLQEGQMVQQGSPEEVFQSGALDQVFQAHIRRVDTPNGWRYYYD